MKTVIYLLLSWIVFACDERKEIQIWEYLRNVNVEIQ